VAGWGVAVAGWEWYQWKRVDVVNILVQKWWRLEYYWPRYGLFFSVLFFDFFDFFLIFWRDFARVR
jgi:hypothetical protein